MGCQESSASARVHVRPADAAGPGGGKPQDVPLLRPARGKRGRAQLDDAGVEAAGQGHERADILHARQRRAQTAARLPHGARDDGGPLADLHGVSASPAGRSATDSGP